jgi:putative tricarboxylic transport membrane protein
MIIWGLRPGPLLFSEQPDFVWGLIGSMYVANFVTVLLNLAMIPIFVRVLAMPFSILTPIIFILCFVGVFATTDRMFDVWLMLVLGPLAERSMRQSLISSRGDAFTFINPAEHPISLACIIVAILLMLYPLFLNFRRKRTKKAAT